MGRAGPNRTAINVVTWLSIITVVRNDAVGLERTLSSLESDLGAGVEWVVVDGSDDPAVVPRIVGDRGLVKWSRPSGIYPAMNEGLNLASGEFVLFLNAGDALTSATVLADIERRVFGSGARWGFGRIEIIEATGARVVTPEWDYAREAQHMFARGFFTPHQATFARREDLARLGGFDETYRIAADYKVFLQLSQLSAPAELKAVVSDFPLGGASSTNWFGAQREFHRARREVLQPSGLAAWQERCWTLRGLAQAVVYRLAVLPARRLARR